MTTVAVALVTPVTGRRDALLAAFQEIIPAVLAEKGCEQYDASLERDGDRIIIVERWTSDADLAAHGAGSAIARLRELGVGSFDSQVLILADPAPAVG